MRKLRGERPDWTELIRVNEIITRREQKSISVHKTSNHGVGCASTAENHIGFHSRSEQETEQMKAKKSLLIHTILDPLLTLLSVVDCGSHLGLVPLKDSFPLPSKGVFLLTVTSYLLIRDE